MDSIPYIGARSAVESPMGIILPLALIASILLLMSLWKPERSENGYLGKSFVTGLLGASAIIWTVIWGVSAIDYNDRSREAADAASMTLENRFGLALDPQDALDLVQGRTGERIIAQSPEGRMILEAEWEDSALVIYSTGFEAASMARLDR